MIKISLDAMGGDFGPEPIINGLVDAFKVKKDFKAILVGKKSEIIKFLPTKFDTRVEFVECDDVISMSDQATDALKRKDSSIYKAIELVRNNEADAIVSAGHSGATMSLATLRIGRLKGVTRPAIAAFMPTTENQNTLVLDVGANTDCNAQNLYEFAIMGKLYSKNIMNLEEPLFGLVSNGEESSKGNEVSKEAHKLLQDIPGFVGNIEGNNIFDGSIDVAVCDGFVGNILLKTSEGVASAITQMVKKDLKRSIMAIAGAVLMRKIFKRIKLKTDYAEYGGAPLIGVKAPVIIAHGKSNAKAMKNAIFQAIEVANSHLNDDIEQELELYKLK